MVSQTPVRPVSSRRGFTITELLVAMALIVLIMEILSAAFAAGLETFRQLKGSGDLTERLRASVVTLRKDIAEAHFSARKLISDGLRTGVVDPQAADDLRADYEAIRDSAADLEPQLREVERKTTNPVARRVLRRAIDDLNDMKRGAEYVLMILDSIAKITPHPPGED